LSEAKFKIGETPFKRWVESEAYERARALVASGDTERALWLAFMGGSTHKKDQSNEKMRSQVRYLAAIVRRLARVDPKLPVGLSPVVEDAKRFVRTEESEESNHD
jgi:hypothetical protein